MTEQKILSSEDIFLKTKNAYYCGTTVGNSWWRRYMKDGWLSRGNSEIWLDNSSVRFRRYLTRTDKVIPFKDIMNITVGKWHAGKWTGAPIIRISWKKDGIELVSGFSVSRDAGETVKWVEKINFLMKKQH